MTERNDGPGWSPRPERKIWPWVLLVVLVVGIAINVALTI